MAEISTPKLIVFATLALPLICHAAISPTSPSIEIQKALRLPLSRRIESIERQGLAGRKELEKIAFDQNEALENRWRAVTAMGRTYGPKAQDFLEQALKSSEWFMRNSATIVLQYGNRAWAIRWAEAMLSDPALVVRTAAVDTLRNLNAVEARDILWQKLYNAQNYRAGHSLWIRHHILTALVQFATPGQEGLFQAALNDKDSTLKPIAKQGLDKIRAQKFTR